VALSKFCTQLHYFLLFSPTTLHSITPFLAFFTYNIAPNYTIFSLFFFLNFLPNLKICGIKGGVSSNSALNYTIICFFHPQHCTQLHPFLLFSLPTLHSITLFFAYFTYNIALNYTLFCFFHLQHCTVLHCFLCNFFTMLHISKNKKKGINLLTFLVRFVPLVGRLY